MAYTRCNSFRQSITGRNTEFDPKHAVLKLKVLTGNSLDFMVGQFVRGLTRLILRSIVCCIGRK